VFISADKAMVYSDDTVVLTVKEKNDGDVLLTSTYVMLDSTKPEKTSLEYSGGDTNDDGILDPGNLQASSYVAGKIMVFSIGLMGSISEHFRHLFMFELRPIKGRGRLYILALLSSWCLLTNLQYYRLKV
jgi:hypothetical protein